MIEKVRFDGHLLNELCIPLVSQRSPAGVEVNTEDILGRDGKTVTSARYLPPEVTLVLVAPDADVYERRRLVRALSPILLTKEPKRLEISSDDGLSYMAMVNDRPEFTELVNGGSMEVTFLVTSVAMQGKDTSVRMTGNTTLLIGGTYETPLRIAGTVTPSNGYFGIRMDGSDFIRVAMDSQGTIEVDCSERTCKVNGIARQITLDSDWLVPSAGRHELSFDPGSGDVTVGWTEMWL